MSVAATLLDDLERIGCTVILEDGKPRFRGAAPTGALKDRVKEHRADIIAEVERRKAQDRDRFQVVPPADAPCVGSELKLTATQRGRLMSYVFRQPRPMHAWVMHRSRDYFDKGIKQEDCDACACVDVLAWQRGGATPQQSVQWLDGIKED